MELKYTPKVINEIEMETKKPIQEVISDFSMQTIVLLVKKGLGADEEKAYEAIEKELTEGKDTFVLYVEIMEKLQGAGFLPRQLDLGKMKNSMAKALEKEK